MHLLHIFKPNKKKNLLIVVLFFIIFFFPYSKNCKSDFMVREKIDWPGFMGGEIVNSCNHTPLFSTIIGYHSCNPGISFCGGDEIDTLLVAVISNIPLIMLFVAFILYFSWCGIYYFRRAKGQQ
jgi:hypothetical protein